MVNRTRLLGVARACEFLARGIVAAGALSGCTYGFVIDDNGDTVGGATVKFDTLKTSESYKGATTFGTASESVKTWNKDDPNSGGHNGLYYLNPNAHKATGDNTALNVPAGWQRVTVSKSGYDSAIFYRDHQYSQSCDIYSSLPYADAKYPVTSATSVSSGGKTPCSLENFTLSSSSTNYEKLPDMLADPRSLTDTQIATGSDCKYKDDNAVERQFTKCLRVSVGTPNVGAGDLHLLGELDSGGHAVNVRQRIYKRNSGYSEKSIPANFTFEDAAGHHHFHFKNWTKLRLRKYDASCPTQGWTNCPELKTGRKVSFCIEDIYTFESSIATGKKYACDTTTGAGGTTQISQGISVGMQDVYGKSVYGQVVDIAGLASGKYWLEVEVNPEHFMTERDYSNNLARVTVTIP